MPATPLSRYEFAPVEVDECGRTFLDVPDPITPRSRPSDLRTTSVQGDIPHVFAWRAYRSMLDPDPVRDLRPTRFWDVVAEYNGLIDAVPFLEGEGLVIPNGTSIRVPDVDVLLGEIRVPPPFFSAFESEVVTP